MKHIIRLFLIAILSCFCSLSLAEPSKEQIQTLLDLSGLTKQVNSFPEAVAAGFKQGLQQDPNGVPDDIDKLTQSVDSAVSPSVILDKVAQSVSKTMTKAEINSLLQWYESDIGKKITAAEEKASTAEAVQKMMENADALLANSKLVEYAKQLDALLNATDSMLDMQESTGLAVFSAMMATQETKQTVTVGDFKAQMSSMRPQMRPFAEQMITLTFAYTYQSIDDASLAQYKDFLAKDTTQRFNNSVVEGMQQGFNIVIVDWAKSLAEIMNSNRNN